jgi:hypothetical protein
LWGRPGAYSTVEHLKGDSFMQAPACTDRESLGEIRYHTVIYCVIIHLAKWPSLTYTYKASQIRIVLYKHSSLNGLVVSYIEKYSNDKESLKIIEIKRV